MNKLKPGEAKTNRKCATCPTVFEVGDPLFMVIDVLQNKLTDLICKGCGQETYDKQEGQTSAAKKPSTDFETKVIDLLEKILEAVKMGL